MRLHLASANRHKVAELQTLARTSNPGLKIIGAAQVGGMPPVVEDAGTFIGNARRKARALRRRLPADTWVLADDSGLCVDALDGAPGVDSATFAGPQGDDAANLAKLIKVLREVPTPARTAHFLCVLLVLGPSGAEQVFEGRCEGRLLAGPRGSTGFGYDPVFILSGMDETFAELSAARKNRLSHRALAWEQLAAWVRQGP